MSKTILISGASSGFGALTARALADAGHTVYAGMRDVAGRNAAKAQGGQAVLERAQGRPPLGGAAPDHGMTCSILRTVQPAILRTMRRT
jgi:NAD(P)-dependent dehydrogenase (short-subunit alcohol dehydrogenase family)